MFYDVFFALKEVLRPPFLHSATFYLLAMSGVGLANKSFAHSCAHFFALSTSSTRLSNLLPDERIQSIPLFKGPKAPNSNEQSYMGYEILKVDPALFKNAEAIRDFVNLHEETAANHPGQRRIDVFGKGSTGFRRPLKREAIIKAILREFPAEIAEPLIHYVHAVLNDLQIRGYKLNYFNMDIRTERYPFGFKRGHSHEGGGLNYGIAPIGRNTEIDLKNRFIFRDAILPEVDYFSTNSPDQVVVFGGVWHRTPNIRPGEPRLILLIGVSPYNEG